MQGLTSQRLPACLNAAQGALQHTSYTAAVKASNSRLFRKNCLITYNACVCFMHRNVLKLVTLLCLMGMGHTLLIMRM